MGLETLISTFAYILTAIAKGDWALGCIFILNLKSLDNS